MNRVCLPVLFVALSALFAASPASGAGALKCKLTPTGVEPSAAGQATLTNVVVNYQGWIYSVTGTLTIRCTGLTPNAQYSLGVTDSLLSPQSLGVTNAKGVLKATVPYDCLSLM